MLGLGFITKIFRPVYALAALGIFTLWQGVPVVKNIVSPPASADPVSAEPAKQLGAFEAAITSLHPGARILSWLIIYVLVCLATIPLINSVLKKESNTANAFLLVAYTAFGFLLAFFFTAFRINWRTTIMLFFALGISLWIIIAISSKAEQLRVESQFR